MYMGELENEHYLLSAFLMGYEKESVLKNCIAYGLQEQHFTDETNKKIFKIILSQYKRGYSPTTCTVFDVADKNVKMKLAQFGGEGGGTLSYKFFLENLMEDYFSKNASNEMSHLLQKYNQTKDHDEKAGYWKQIKELSRDNPYETLSANESSSFSDSADKFLKKLEQDMEESMKEKLPGIETGLGFLDDILCGWRKGKLYVIGARSGVGKTTLACNFAFMAASKGAKVCFFTVEMFEDEISEKVVSRASGVSTNAIRLGRSNETDITKLQNSIRDLSSKPFQTNDKTRGNFETFERELRRLAEIDAVELVIFDYIQLFRLNKKTQNRNSEIAEMTMQLKQLALELNVAIIALSQLNRATEHDNREPRPSDLRDSGSIEQDADAILFLTADENENRYLAIAKNRNGKQNVKVPLKTKLDVNYLGEYDA